MSEQDPNAYPPGWPPVYPPPQQSATPPAPGQPSPGYPGGQPSPGYPSQQGYAVPGYPGAGAYPAGHLAAEVIPGPGGPVAPSRRRGRRTAIVAAAVTVGVVGVAGAATAVYSRLNGGGDQPESHLPANAAVVLRIDLDPSLSQKVDALRFATKFPGTPQDLDWGKADRDPRKWVYEQLTQSSKDAPAWSEISGWLGKRAAVAVLPGSPDPVPVVALQVTDEAKARATFDRTKGSDDTGFAAKDGWLLVSDTQAHADEALASASSSPLSELPAFSEDIDALGDQGIASAWFDDAALSKIARSSAKGSGVLGLNGLGSVLNGQTGVTQLVKGHGAIALRFSGANLELAGKLHGLDVPSSIGSLPPAKVNLPADSLAVLQVAGLGDATAKAWPDVAKQLATIGKTTPSELTSQIEQALDLKLPADLRPMLGEQFGVAVGAGPGGAPAFGIRVDSSSPDLERVSGAMSKLAGEGIRNGRTTVKTFSGGYAIATSDEQAAGLAGGGDLAGSERFKNAVPDADGASVVMYADLEKIFQLVGTDSMSQSERKAVEALQAVGFSARSDGDGEQSFALRLTTR